MRFLVIGAGAIGGYAGGSLALNQHSVAFLCRPQTAARLRQEGLTITLPAGAASFTPEVHEAAEDALRTGSFDLAILAVKRYDLRAALEPLAPLGDRLPPILCLQNGVDAEAEIAQVLGGQVIPGTVLTAVARRAPGEIVVEKFRGMGVAGDHPLAAGLAGVLSDAGLNARHYPHAASMQWSKLLTNLTANPLSAILNLPPAKIFAHPGLFRLEMRQLREALAVMRKLGAKVVDLPGTPVRALAFGARLPAGVARPLLSPALGRGRGAKMPSFHVDLHSGRGRSEVGWLHGAVVRHGERVGVATPVNRWLSETLTSLVQGELPLNAYRPEKVIAELQ
jgi:2-dehydropantoate 2-reductase